MRQRAVVFSPEALDDLIDLYDWIADKASPSVAIAYVDRLEAFCRKLDTASERGLRRDDIRPGLRVVGFERRVAVAFTISDDTVTVLRLHYGGRDWESTEG